jgi:predicted Zn finger-like uncharacterized protein
VIVTCPNCSAQFRLSAAVVARRAKLKCAECAHRWVPDEDVDEDEAVAAVLEDVRTAAAPPPPPPAPEPEPEPPPPEMDPEVRGQRMGIVKTIVAIVLGAALSVAAAGLWVGRIEPDAVPLVGDQLASLFPQPPALKITASASHDEIGAGAGILEVSGRITNPARESQAVPMLEATLIMPDGSIRRWPITPPVVRLAPGASADYSSNITGVPAGPHRVQVRMVP